MKTVTAEVLLLNKRRPDVPMTGTLTYTPAIDPYAVTLVFQGHDEITAKTFSRDLLAAGLREPVGPGDVRIGPVGDDDWVLIAFRSDALGTRFEVFIPRDQVTAFVARSYRVVAANDEHEWIDWDREVTQLLAAEQTRRTEIRLWEMHGWRSRTGTLAAAPGNPRMVVVQVPTSYGSVITWQTPKALLAAQAEQARHPDDGWVRLAVPGDETLLVQADAIVAFLAGAS
ncbi:SsgA family sporulation/cell division regulator [Streptosporangium sp. NPDC050855]|uniref:SsgA family sporulation/cell division regulator n=1 Tax=Streptosporangium sp. NPDC050855 TaxID=3366194 RepID=UPI00378EB656